MKKKFLIALILVLSLLSINAFAEQYLPKSNGTYSVTYTASEYGEYVLTCIKGIYSTENEALSALYAVSDEQINYFDTQRADKDGRVVFDSIVPFSYTDSSVFISGTNLEKPVFLGHMLADGKSDIASAVFVGVEEKYIVNGLAGEVITETVTSYTFDSFGFPTLSNPTLFLTLVNPDEYVSLSSDGILSVSPMAIGGEYTLKASLDSGFSDTFTFRVERAQPFPYSITVYRPDAHDREMESKKLVGVEGVYPTFSMFARTKDQFGNDFSDEYTCFVNDVEYPDGFTPTQTGEYTLYVASKNRTQTRKAVTLYVTNRPEYTGNALVLYEKILQAEKELDRLDYEVFISNEQGKDIYPSFFWTTQTAVTNLENALSTAQELIDKYPNTLISEERYLSASNTLSSAVSAYLSQVHEGVRVDATKITLSQTDILLKSGKKVAISALLEPSDNNDVVTWSVSDSDVIFFYNGMISGVNTGEAYVTATTRSGLSASCKVNVYRPFTSLYMKQRNQKILLGEENKKILITAIPENGGDKLTWTSSNESVATIKEDGTIVAHNAGTTTVTATNLDGSLADYCYLTVNIPADTINLGIEQVVTLNKGEIIPINAVAARLDGKIPSSTAVSYSVIDSDPKVPFNDVVVIENGNIRAMTGGTAKVRISAIEAIGVVYKDIEVSVKSSSESISVPIQRKMLAIGKTLALSAHLLPADTTDEVFWHSVNEEVATVDSFGVVTAKAIGTTRICATTTSGLVKYCTVAVGFGATDIEVLSSKSSIGVGEQFILKAKAVRTDGKKCIDSSVSYSTIKGRSNISIDENGVVTGLEEGTSTIRITAVNGEGTVQKNITINIYEIYEEVTEISFTEKEKELFVGQTFDFSSLISLLPETNTALVTFESSDTRHLTVDENGVATAISEGTARLYARSESLTAYITVNIKACADSVELSKAEKTTLYFGESLILTATSRDKDGNTIDGNILWESSDENIISVSANGQIKAGITAGKATIIARDLTSDVFDSIEFTVVPSLYTVSLKEENIVLEKEENFDVLSLISLTDVNGNELETSLCTFSLRSRDESVVLVNDMTITAQNEGSTSVRIIVYCGNVSRSVNLRVTVNQDIDASFAFETVSSEAIFENLVVESANEIEF